MRFFIELLKNQQTGFSLILSMVILMAIFGLVIVVTDVALDIAASNKAIGSSEVALFAAESAAELTIYDIEFNNASFGLPAIGDQSLTLPNGTAYWNREIQLATNTPGLCVLGDPTITPSPVCTNNQDPVSSANHLFVTLLDSQSFQLDLDIPNADAFYPAHVYINHAAAGSRLIVSGEGTQVIHLSPFNITIPDTGTLQVADNYKIRIFNESGATQTYDIDTQVGHDEMPLGLEIRTWGRYNTTERNITLIRPAWLIY